MGWGRMARNEVGMKLKDHQIPVPRDKTSQSAAPASTHPLTEAVVILTEQVKELAAQLQVLRESIEDIRQALEYSFNNVWFGSHSADSGVALLRASVGLTAAPK